MRVKLYTDGMRCAAMYPAKSEKITCNAPIRSVMAVGTVAKPKAAVRAALAATSAISCPEE